MVNPAGSSGPIEEGTIKMPEVTISGIKFDVKAPYEEGHALTAVEAKVLNQTYLENVRNNLASKVKAAKEKAGDDFNVDAPVEGDEEGRTLRTIVQEYADNYEFGERATRSSEPADPVEREARSIAREAINAQLRSKGVKRKDVDDAAYEQAVATHAQNPAIRAEAERRVAARAELGLGELNLPTAEAPATEGETSDEQPAATRGRRQREAAE